jgi:hypothetical protein
VRYDIYIYIHIHMSLGGKGLVRCSNGQIANDRSYELLNKTLSL